MTTKDSVVAESLKICFKVARILKKEFPNQVMAIKDDTIIVYSRKSRLIRRSGSRGMSGIYAYFTNYTPHRIVIARSTLLDRKVASTYGHWVFQKIVTERVVFYECPKCKVRFDDEYKVTAIKHRTQLQGNWACAELIVHETSHHMTKGHQKGWKKKYARFLQFMANQFISGNFYKS